MAESWVKNAFVPGKMSPRTKGGFLIKEIQDKDCQWVLFYYLRLNY